MIASLLALGLALAAPAGAAQEEEQAEEVTAAEPEALKALLAEHAAAAKAKDGKQIIAALKKMARHDNPELLAPALKALGYKASRVDKTAVKADAAELGITKKEVLDQRVREREAEVRAAAARVLANIDDKKSTSGLVKALKDKKNQKERPTALAAVIDALGRLGHSDAAELVEYELKRYRHKDVSRACVRYFGQVKCKRMSVAKLLAESLAAPVPEEVDSAANPPASYWEERWKTWQHIRRDVSWALKEITGQVFAPDEGTTKGDSKKALRYIEEHAKELGLK